MKITANYHESYQPKRGFGATLLFYAFLLSLIGLSKAFAQSPTITSPANGTTINNRCDLQFCVAVDGSAPPSIVYILDAGMTVINAAYTSSSNFCLGLIYSSANVSQGTQTFYLAINSSSPSDIVDSVTLNIVNPIPNLGTLINSISLTSTPTTNGGYNFTVNGLSASESYTINANPGGYYSAPTNDDQTFVINNATSANISHQFDYNGAPMYTIKVLINCGYDSTLLWVFSDSVVVSNSNCSSYIAFDYAQSYQTYCSSSNNLYGQISYSNLNPQESSQLVIYWGDGSAETIQIPHNGNSSGTFSLNSVSHQYSAPGVYTNLFTLVDPSACYVDSILVFDTVGSTSCGSLLGTVYNDINTNCAWDIGTDVGLSSIMITATDNNSNVYYAWTDFNGNYSFNTLPDGTYVVDLTNLNSVYSLTCSGAFPQTVIINNNSVIANCAVTCSGAFDLAVLNISIWSGLYPGQIGPIFPHVGLLNVACNTTVVAGHVKIVLDACTQYTNPSIYNNGAGAPDAIITAASGDTLVWNVADINNIGNFSYFDYAINVMTCTTAQVGDSACITIIVEPTTGDADPSNNTYTRCFEIGVSYDPNNKEVQPTGVEAAGFIPANQPSLTYTLNFQNTGTAKAFNVYLMDTIDTDLDINSIEILSASHKMQAYTLENRAVKFMFADIMLPDSTHDEPNSHGYVTFKIKLNAGLTPGTEIENTGHIYFDYNEPVVTNTTLNTIEFPSSVQSLGKSSVVKVFPNPAKESVTVVSNSNSAGQITITDLLGKTVKEVTTTNEKTVVNTADLQSGVYFIKLTQNNVSKTEKIMIAK